MDNLTHSLAGAVLGQMGLKRRTGLALPALVIGANLPDIDAVCAVFGTQSLAMRRGLTHGPIALVVLPLLLTGALLLWAHWRPNPKRLPVHCGWLLAMAYIGTLSHPALDWLNSYGIRFLEPFSSQWFAGGTLFIVDVWIWTALALGVWLSQRRERRGQPNWRGPAVAGFVAVCLYILANGLITGGAEAETRGQFGQPSDPSLKVVANPVPVIFWQRDILWRNKRFYGQGTFKAGQGVSLDRDYLPIICIAPCTTSVISQREHHAADPRLRAAARSNPDAAAFLFWSRMPVATFGDTEVILSDQRFGNPLVRSRFEVRVPLKDLK